MLNRVALHLSHLALADLAQLCFAFFACSVLNAGVDIAQAQVCPELLGEANEDAGADQVKAVLVLLVEANTLDAAIHITCVIISA